MVRRGLELVGIILIVACIIGIVVLTTVPQCTDYDRNALVCLNLRSGRPAPVAPTALTPGTAPTVSSPAPAPQEEAAPIVAAAPGALTPGTAPTVSSPAPAALPVEPGASTAEISALLARGDAAATRWYRRARDLGSSDAEILLKSVGNR
jgi:hypothetical protein